MSEMRTLRLNKVLKELNISLDRAVEHLSAKGHEIEARPTTKISEQVYEVLLDEFQSDKSKRTASKEVGAEKRAEKEAIKVAREEEIKQKRIDDEAKSELFKARADKLEVKTVGKIDLDAKKSVEPTENNPKSPQPVEDKIEPTLEDKKEVSVKAEAPKKDTVKPTITKVVKKPVVVGKIDLDAKATPVKKEKVDTPKKESIKTEESIAKSEEKPEASQTEATTESTDTATKETEQEAIIKTKYEKLSGPKLIGTKIDLKQFEKPKKKVVDTKKATDDKKRKRKRIVKPAVQRPPSTDRKSRGASDRTRRRPAASAPKAEPTEEEVKKQVRETLERLQGKSSKNKGAKYRKEKRDQHRQQIEISQEIAQAETKTLKVTEFVTVGELASMMDVQVTKIISACMSLGLMVTMNQRLDAETLSIVAEEFDYKVDFVDAEVEESVQQVVEDRPEDLKPRAPIVTVMGHVDHGKTSLLDFIRKGNVIAGESGGITQHIGAYSVELKNKQKISFLDTPGHEAFTAMRARGAQVTDIAIIVIAADDDVMPQTKEAISHAQAAGVPMIFAFNKIDKPDANPDKLKEQLSAMNLLVEEWGGKIQSQEISAKTGLGVDDLLEKVLLEAELLELKANPDKISSGTVVEAKLDKGRGYVATILVQDGTLNVGDYMLAGKNSGKIKAMFDEREHRLDQVGPSTPVSILGLDGAPQAGDKFTIFTDEREAKQIASKRSQLQREQSIRAQRHITLDEIGRRIALGDFKELNIILKGDVDGSVEALTDSFQKLSTEEIQVKIIHKGVGPITESDVLLASASEAIIIGFNVRPSGNARQIADLEEIDIRTYSIIYDAINDLKDAMEGMLSPELKEEILGNVEIREIFKISKVGNIAGCMVTSGKIMRNSKIRIIREGVVIHDGTLTALKRFKDDVKEVSKGYDCGLQIANFNNIEEGDVIEAYQEISVKKLLKRK